MKENGLAAPKEVGVLSSPAGRLPVCSNFCSTHRSIECSWRKFLLPFAYILPPHQPHWSAVACKRLNGQRARSRGGGVRLTTWQRVFVVSSPG